MQLDFSGIYLHRFLVNYLLIEFLQLDPNGLVGFIDLKVEPIACGIPKVRSDQREVQVELVVPSIEKRIVILKSTWITSIDPSKVPAFLMA
jgi:hypothetical protein